MNKILNLVEMWLHRGFNTFKRIANRIFDCILIRIINPIYIFINKHKLNKYMTKFSIFCIALVAGILLGQTMLMNKITDDCRILRATRFGEVYIGCGTAQKL